MIGRMLSYPYGSTRARALATRLLNPDEFSGWATKGYSDHTIAEIEHRLSLGDGEASLDHRLHADYLAFARIIIRTLPEAPKDLFEAYLERPWLENLLVLCRCRFGWTEQKGDTDFLPMMPGHIPLPKPHRVQGLQDIVDALPKGAYREVLIAFSRQESEGELALLESGLIKAYWDLLLQRVNRLPSVDREGARDILGKRADIDALRIIGRSVDAGLDGKQIRAIWPRLAGGFDLERLLRGLKFSQPGQSLDQLLRRTINSDAGDGGFEMALRRRLHRHLRRSLLGSPFDIAVPLSALLLKELEVSDLQGLLGGLRFKLDQEALQRFLVCS